MAAKSGLGLFMLLISEVLFCCYFILFIFFLRNTDTYLCFLINGLEYSTVTYCPLHFWSYCRKELSPFSLTQTLDRSYLNVNRQAFYLGSYLLNNTGQSWLWSYSLHVATGPQFLCLVFSFCVWEGIWRTLDLVSSSVTLTLTPRAPRPENQACI